MSIAIVYDSIKSYAGDAAAKRYLQLVHGLPITPATEPPEEAEGERRDLNELRRERLERLLTVAASLKGTEPSLRKIFITAGVSTGSTPWLSAEDKHAICAAAGTVLKTQCYSETNRKAQSARKLENQAKIREAAQEMLEEGDNFCAMRISERAGLSKSYLTNLNQQELKAEIKEWWNNTPEALAYSGTRDERLLNAAARLKGTTPALVNIFREAKLRPQGLACLSTELARQLEKAADTKFYSRADANASKLIRSARKKVEANRKKVRRAAERRLRLGLPFSAAAISEEARLSKTYLSNPNQRELKEELQAMFEERQQA